ncbi:MAG: YiiX family permuted papain-like enzyme [Cytophagaceae bacterium]|nr:YiiX family permuted papain-like enzyme [Cytophagaceae bacterium]
MNKLFLIACLLLGACEHPETKTFNYPPSDFVNKQASENKKDKELKSGDIIFQSTSGGQGKVIQIATGSKYSHVGIVYKEGNDFYVFEAVQPVKITPLEKWIDRGDNDHYVVKRLKNADKVLTNTTLKKMKDQGKRYIGKDYDLYFGWADDKIYCSELVWKIYKQSCGVELGKLQQLKDFDLSNPIVQYKLKERYGKNIPYEENVISPAAIYDSELLEEVTRN